jgi:chromosome partitioning protein
LRPLGRQAPDRRRTRTRRNKIVRLVDSLHETHDVVVIDTAGAATQATIFAIGCADIVEAIKTMNLIKSASLIMKRTVAARVVLTGYQPNTNISTHVEAEIAKADLPLMRTRLNRLVAFQEMSFTGIVPTTGLAGVQCANFIEEIVDLGGIPQASKLAS